MAHPLKVGKMTTSGPGILLKRPDLAAQIGSICADWAYVESNLAAFYAHLMGVYLPKFEECEPPTHPVALQVFEEVQTIHARVQLVSKLAEWVIKDEGLKKDTIDVLDKLRKAGSGRNKVAHAVWGICEGEPDALILLPTFGHQTIYKKSDFEAIARKIKESMADLARIHHAFYRACKGGL